MEINKNNNLIYFFEKSTAKFVYFRTKCYTFHIQGVEKMKKVIKEEKTNLNGLELKKMILKGLAALLVTTSLTASLTGCATKKESIVPEKTETVAVQPVQTEQTEKTENPYLNSEPTITRNHEIVDSFDNLQINNELEDTRNQELEHEHDLNNPFEDMEIMWIADDPDLWPYAPTAQIEVDGIILEIVNPEEQTIDGKTVYTLPEGYLLQGDFGYRLMTEYGEAPEGYSLGKDGVTLYDNGNSSNYKTPEGNNYILVGDKVVEVIRARKETINGLNYDMLPSEYDRVNEFGYIITEAEPAYTKSK